MLLKEEVEAVVGRFREWYESKGYVIPYCKGLTLCKTKIKVKVEDLMDASNVRVVVRCDGCKEVLAPICWVDYKRCVKVDGKYYCLKCANNGFKKWVSFEEWCYGNLSKEDANVILMRWDYELNVDKKGKVLSPKDVSHKSRGVNKGYWFKCLQYPEHPPELKSISDFTNGHKGSVLCKSCNSIRVTAPYLMKYFLNEKDVDKYSVGSGEKVPMVCPICKHERDFIISRLFGKGFSCPKCSDGIPYPEKFMFNVLMQLNTESNVQLSKIIFDWCGDYKYDFYVGKFDCVIETHGLQHYEEPRDWGKSKRRKAAVGVHENDERKELLAKENGISNYIVLDCRKSEMKWIKNSIMNSELPKLLKFKERDIDWLMCHEHACSSFVKKSCDLWNSGLGIKEIADILKTSKNSVWKYLKQGAEMGWCDYDPIEERRKTGETLGKKTKRKQVICLTTGETFNSIGEAAKKYNISPSGISGCCSSKVKQKTAGIGLETGEQLTWMLYKDYLCFQ